MWQNKRSYDQEILDLGPEHYTQKEYHKCLKYLCRINQLLGGFKATQRACRNLRKIPKSILEVGCGGGYLCHRLHQWYPNAAIVGIDLCSEAIKHAQKYSTEQNVTFTIQKNKTLDYQRNTFDLVTTMLVCHHMDDEELIKFLKESYNICSKAVIINDLHRHFLAYLSFSFIAPFLFPSRLIWHDGRLSIKRAFRKRDWRNLLEKAGFEKKQYTLQWNWAFRWTLTIHKL